MTPSAAAAVASFEKSAQPTPPPPPATIPETGLHPDTLSQLLLKTLVAGEATGTALAEKFRLPYSVLDALVQHARVEKLVEVRGGVGHRAGGLLDTPGDQLVGDHLDGQHSGSHTLGAQRSDQPDGVAPALPGWQPVPERLRP